MLKFKDITLSDKSTIESYTHYAKHRNCDLSFANIFCWQPVFESAYAIVDGFLVIRFRIGGSGEIGYMQPIGCEEAGSFSHLIPSLADDANTLGQRLRLIGLPEGCASRLRGDYFSLYSSRDDEDYIYLREDLVTLRGKRYQPKRNHINQSQKQHSLEYVELNTALFDECLAMDARWRRENGEHNNIGEEQAIKRAFAHFEELGLRGGALIEDGRVVAFTYGSAINSDTFCIHIEKAERSIIGAYTLINNLFAESLPQHYTYINREEDMGIEGLRRAKLSYHPHCLEAKYTATYLNHDERECKYLWREVFEDDDRFIDNFLHCYFTHDGFISQYSSNKLVSMLHIVDMESEAGRVAYIYAVATSKEVRGKGHASKLIREAIEKITNDGYNYAILIPSSEELFDFYAQFGFKRGECVSFSTPDSFDFGGDDPSQNIIMYLPISPSVDNTTHPSITQLIYRKR
ncbi:MAG: GNAT family N-acetyltransferase [Rikenellaceae bacterium]